MRADRACSVRKREGVQVRRACPPSCLATRTLRPRRLVSQGSQPQGRRPGLSPTCPPPRCKHPSPRARTTGQATGFVSHHQSPTVIDLSGWVRVELKIRVSAVQLRPGPPFSIRDVIRALRFGLAFPDQGRRCLPARRGRRRALWAARRRNGGCRRSLPRVIARESEGDSPAVGPTRAYFSANVARRVARSSACSSSIARMPSSIRRDVGSSLAR